MSAHAFSSAVLRSPAAAVVASRTLQRCGSQACPTSGRGNEDERPLRRLRGWGHESGAVPPVVHEVLRSPGESLHAGTRALMEQRFGHDFSRVRVHKDTRSAESATAVNALAYTVGADIVFAAEQYSPMSSSGRSLLAHELTHVVQQGQDLTTGPSRSLTLGEEGSTHESEAASAARMLWSSPVGLATRANGAYRTIQRQADDTETSPEGVGDSGASVPVGLSSAKPRWRISAPTHPGWVTVAPTYLFIKGGEPFEFPHFLEVTEDSSSGTKKNVVAQEGRFKGKDADVDSAALVAPAKADPAASAKFDIGKGEFWYGGTGPVAAKTDPANPVPTGTHDIEIPDFHHSLGSGYGDLGTTWFRLGHSGDRYLHPGRVSLGCATISAVSEWPKIWSYLISARKDDQSVGRLDVL